MWRAGVYEREFVSSCESGCHRADREMRYGESFVIIRLLTPRRTCHRPAVSVKKQAVPGDKERKTSTQ